MQIFSVQFVDGVALVNHRDCYDDAPGFLELPDGEIINIEPQEPPARLWTRRSRLFGFHDRRFDDFVGHHSPRNCGRKPVYAK